MPNKGTRLKRSFPSCVRMDVIMAQSQPIATAVKKIGVTEKSYSWWRNVRQILEVSRCTHDRDVRKRMPFIRERDRQQVQAAPSSQRRRCVFSLGTSSASGAATSEADRPSSSTCSPRDCRVRGSTSATGG